MRKEDRVWLRGGVAFLAADSDLTRDDPGGGNRSAQHWISYADNFQIDEASEEIGFTCFSWGKLMTPRLAKDSFKHQVGYIVYGDRSKPR